MKNCSRCGAPCADEAKFCTQCGAGFMPLAGPAVYSQRSMPGAEDVTLDAQGFQTDAANPTPVNGAGDGNPYVYGGQSPAYDANTFGGMDHTYDQNIYGDMNSQNAYGGASGPYNPNAYGDMHAQYDPNQYGNVGVSGHGYDPNQYGNAGHGHDQSTYEWQSYQQQPYGQAPNMGNQPPQVNVTGIQPRSIAIAIILTIVTFGIYGIYWMIKLNDEINQMANEPNATSGGLVFLFTLITCGIYGLYWQYKMGERCDRIKGSWNGYSAILYLIFGVLGLSIVSYALMQDTINKCFPYGA